MFILRLEAENIKRLKVVEVKPQGNTVVICGENAQGKSSVLDAISYAMGGKKAVCEKPVRDGQDKAKVVTDLGDLIVTRTFTKDGGGTLTVSNKDGAKYSSPQKILDDLTGKLTFDPLDFCKMEPKAQLETLKSLVGLDFTEQDQRRKELYDQRTQINRDLKNAKANLDKMPELEDIPDHEISVTELMQELKRRQGVNQENQIKRDELAELDKRVAKGQEIINDLEKQIAELQARLEKANMQMAQVQEQKKVKQAEVDDLEDAKEQDILSQIEDSEEINKKIRQKEEKQKLLGSVKDLEAQAERLTRDISAIDQGKADALHKTEFPVDGLSFDEDRVLLNGLPFSQASQAEQLRVSIAMGFALNPKLKVLLVRDGSLLDKANLQLIADMAKEYNGQVWIERVGEGKDPAVVIEDGEVKGDIHIPQKETEPAIQANTEEEIF